MYTSHEAGVRRHTFPRSFHFWYIWTLTWKVPYATFLCVHNIDTWGPWSVVHQRPLGKGSVCACVWGGGLKHITQVYMLYNKWKLVAHTYDTPNVCEKNGLIILFFFFFLMFLCIFFFTFFFSLFSKWMLNLWPKTMIRSCVSSFWVHTYRGKLSPVISLRMDWTIQTVLLNLCICWVSCFNICKQAWKVCG